MNQLNPKYLSLGDGLLQNCSTTGPMCAPGIPLPYVGFTGTVAQALLPYPQYAGGGTPGIPTGSGVFSRFPYFGHSVGIMTGIVGAAGGFGGFLLRLAPSRTALAPSGLASACLRS